MPKIRYIKNEFRFGITEYKTPCPFGMRDRYALQVYEVAREIKSAMFYPDASCVLLVIGNYKKAPYTYKFQEIRDRKVTRVKNMSLAKFKYLLGLFFGTPYITFKK